MSNPVCPGARSDSRSDTSFRLCFFTADTLGAPPGVSIYLRLCVLTVELCVCMYVCGLQSDIHLYRVDIANLKKTIHQLERERTNLQVRRHQLQYHHQ